MNTQKRENKKREARAMLSHIDQKIGAKPQCKDFPECPCSQLTEALSLVKQLSQQNKIFTTNIQALVNLQANTGLIVEVEK